MAIKNLGDRARFPELGRIRLGDRELVETKGGKKVERPKKGDTLRFTSNDETALKAIASQHGGEVEPWEKGEQAWQLTSETQWIEALLPPDPLADTPIYERWGSGGVQRRCDGERCLVPVGDNTGGHLEEADCACLAEGLIPGDAKDTKACKVTLRIRLVLPYVPGLGVWLCTSHSWLGALELPGQVAVIDAMRERGQLIAVRFGIEHRSVKKPWESYTREFIVPSVRVDHSLAQLQSAGALMPELNIPGAPVLGLGEQRALPATVVEAGSTAVPDPGPGGVALGGAKGPPLDIAAEVVAIKVRVEALPPECVGLYTEARQRFGLPLVSHLAEWTEDKVRVAKRELDGIEASEAARVAANAAARGEEPPREYPEGEEPWE